MLTDYDGSYQYFMTVDLVCFSCVSRVFLVFFSLVVYGQCKTTFQDSMKRDGRENDSALMEKRIKHNSASYR